MTSPAGAPTAALLESASQGDDIAVDVLLERFLPGLEAFIRLRQGKLLRAKESAADLVQSVCREILQHMDRYQYRGEAQFRHWLYSTAMRKISNKYEYYRAERRDAAREISPPAMGANSSTAEPILLQQYASVCTPSRLAVAHEEMARIEAAFERLPEDQREIILMSRMIGLSHKEIAEALGTTDGNVRVRLSRALAKLAGLLEKKEGTGG
jgi:RNA polymerase sigma-70 factor (ECF subfamily)